MRPAYKRPKLMPRRKKRSPILGIGARMLYASCRSVQAVAITQPGALTNSPVSQVRILMPWQRPAEDTLLAESGNGIYNFQLSIFSTDRFRSMAPIYQQYAITGVKIEYRPTGIMPNEVSPNMVTNGAYNVGIDDYKANVTQIDFGKLVQLQGFKAIKGRSVFGKYISFKRISKQEHLDWQPCGANQLPNTFAEGNLSQAWSMITLLLGSNTTRAFNLGFMKVTWYAKFRGQT